MNKNNSTVSNLDDQATLFFFKGQQATFVTSGCWMRHQNQRQKQIDAVATFFLSLS